MRPIFPETCLVLSCPVPLSPVSCVLSPVSCVLSLVSCPLSPFPCPLSPVSSLLCPLSSVLSGVCNLGQINFRPALIAWVKCFSGQAWRGWRGGGGAVGSGGWRGGGASLKSGVLSSILASKWEKSKGWAPKGDSKELGPRGGAQKGGGPEGCGPKPRKSLGPKVGAPKFRVLFPLPTPFSLFFSLSGVFSWTLAVFLKAGTLKFARLEFSGCRVKPRACGPESGQRPDWANQGPKIRPGQRRTGQSRP